MHKLILFALIYLAVPFLCLVVNTWYGAYTHALYDKRINLADEFAQIVFESTWNNKQWLFIFGWPLVLVALLAMGIFLVVEFSLTFTAKRFGTYVKRKQIKRANKVKEREQQYYAAKVNRPIEEVLNGD